MNKKRIVITGIGVISSLGIGKDEYWNGLKEGRSGISAIKRFNTDSYKVKVAGEANAFDPQDYFTKRELSNSIDRATALILSSSKFAIEDSNLIVTDDNGHDIGVSVGTTFGSLESLSEFDKESIREGPQLVDPVRFPNTVANLPASQVSIFFKIKGFNVTISTGMCASFDAIDYAIKAIRFYDKKIVLTGALEEMCEQTFLGFYRLKALSGCQNGHMPISCPFDQRRDGIVFGEGSGSLILEDLESAKARKAKIYGEILGIASNFDPYRLHKYNPKGTGMAEVMRSALKKAQLNPEDVDYICANANSMRDADLIEAKAIQEVFGKLNKNVPVSSIKSMIGETYSAGGSLGTIASIGALEKNFIPPTINYVDKDEAIDLNLVINKAQEKKLTTVMINSFGQNGANSSLIIRKYNGK